MIPVTEGGIAVLFRQWCRKHWMIAVYYCFYVSGDISDIDDESTGSKYLPGQGDDGVILVKTVRSKRRL